MSRSPVKGDMIEIKTFDGKPWHPGTTPSSTAKWEWMVCLVLSALDLASSVHTFKCLKVLGADGKVTTLWIDTQQHLTSWRFVQRVTAKTTESAIDDPSVVQ